jgi:hypothetical protein
LLDGSLSAFSRRGRLSASRLCRRGDRLYILGALALTEGLRLKAVEQTVEPPYVYVFLKAEV